MVVSVLPSKGVGVAAESIRAAGDGAGRDSVKPTSAFSIDLALAFAAGANGFGTSPMVGRFETPRAEADGLGRTSRGTGGDGGSGNGESRIAGATRDAGDATLRDERGESREVARASEASQRDASKTPVRPGEQEGDTARGNPRLLADRVRDGLGRDKDVRVPSQGSVDGRKNEGRSLPVSAPSGREKSDGLTESPRSNDVHAAVANAAKGVAGRMESVGGAVQSSMARGGGDSRVAASSSSNPDGSSSVRGKDSATGNVDRTASGKKTRSTKSASTRSGALIERIAKVISTKMNGKQTVAHIRLDPPELGQVRIRLQLDGEVVRLRMQSDRVEGYDRLSSNADGLRSALEQQGLRVERIDFGTRPDGAEPDGSLSGERAFQGAREQENRRERSEGVRSGEASLVRDEEAWSDDVEGLVSEAVTGVAGLDVRA